MADIDSLKEEYRSNLTQCIQRVKTELDNKANADDLTELQTQVNIIETNTDIIDDTQTLTNKTNSSSKISTDIQKCLSDSKDYTLQQIEEAKTDNTLTTTDKTITGAINEVNGNLLDTVGFSADYKNIILNRKNGLNPYIIPISSIINNASLTELKDVDSTDIGNGKTLVYDSSTQKHKYVNTTGTDEFVKMDSTTDANYLSNLIDKSTVVNDNGVLKVKKLDGQEVTITEINYLKGLTMNVMDLVNAFANGGVKVLNTPLNTVSELDTMDRTSFIDGISYIVYVLADENHSGAKTTYLVDKTNTTFFGNADSQRNFTTNPIDLANEVTGKLGTSNIDVDGLWTLLTINDTYKTLTTNNEVFGTHGAKAMYDELTTAIGEKANASDLTTHTGDTDIHVSTTQTDKWDKVTDKLDTVDFNTHKDNTDIHITSDERTKWNNATNEEQVKNIVSNKLKGTEITQTVVDTYGTEILKYPVGIWYIDNNSIASNFTDLPAPRAGIIEIATIDKHLEINPWDNVYSSRITTYTSFDNATYVCKLYSGETAGVMIVNTGWKKVCTTSVEDVPVTGLTWADTTHFEVSFTGLNYQVKNGVCFVNIDMTCNSPINEGYKLPITLPTPNTEYVHHRVSSFQQRSSITIAVGNSGTDVIAYGGLKGDRYLGTFSYPVAES